MYCFILVVSFSCNSKVTITHSEKTPVSLERSTSECCSVEGKWKVIACPRHSECLNCMFKIQRQEHGKNMYALFTNVVNMLHCSLEYNPTNDAWKSTGVMSTLMAGPPELMEKENVVSTLLSGINSIQLEGPEDLLIRSTDGIEIKLKRCTQTIPSAVTDNIFA